MNKTRSSFKSWLPRFASPKALALPLSAVLSLALLIALASTSLAAPAAGAGAANGAPAKVVVSQVGVKGQKVTIAGKVTLPLDTAAQRQRTRVALTLSGASGASGKAEQLIAKIDAKRRFKTTKTTKLTGQLTVVALVKIAGKPSGKQVSKRFAGPAAAKAGGDGAGGKKAGTGGGSALPPTPPPGVPPLVGLFKLDPGSQAFSGKFAGTYFRMFGGSAGVLNGSSTALDKTYTLLRPGTDGGLRTDAYQGPPTPAFSGGTSGNSLANRIVLPQSFLAIDFSIATAPVDLQAGTPVPLPTIYAVDGKVGGQIAYWDAQWNGLSFNQGSPKPDGSYPSGIGGQASVWNEFGTIPLQGTYSPSTGHFVVEWQSLIEGGPFDHFTGYWHLEGTFVPAA